MANEPKVYLLSHSFEAPPLHDNDRVVGIYSTRGDAEEAISRLSMQPGFSELTDGFVIDEYALNQDEWREGFRMVVFPVRDKDTNEHPWWKNVPFSTYHAQDAPPGTFIFEVIKNGNSLGCEVGLNGTGIVAANVPTHTAYDVAVEALARTAREQVAPSPRQ